MIAGDDVQAARRHIFGGMAENEPGTGGKLAGSSRMSEETVECDLAEADHDAEIFEQRQLFVQPGRAVALLLGSGLVVGWSAADYCADPKVA
jgi:hypothetical protein